MAMGVPYSYAMQHETALGLGGSPAYKTLAGYDLTNEFENRGYSPESLFMGQPPRNEYLSRYDRQYNHFQYPQIYEGKSIFMGEVLMGLFGYTQNNFLLSETDGLPIRRVSGMSFHYTMFKFNRQPWEVEAEEGVARVFKVSKEQGQTSLTRRAQAIIVEHNFHFTQDGIKLFGMQLINLANNFRMTLEMLVLQYILAIQGRVFEREVKHTARYLPVTDMQALILDENEKMFKAVKTFDGFEQLITPAKEILIQSDNAPTTLLTTQKIKKYLRGVGDALDYQKMGPEGPALAKVSPDSIKMYDGMRAKFVAPYILDNSGIPYDPFIRPVIFGQFFTMFGEDPHTIEADSRGRKYKTSHRTIKIHNQTVDKWADITLKDAIDHLGMWDTKRNVLGTVDAKPPKGYYDTKEGNVHPWSPIHGYTDLFGCYDGSGYRACQVFGDMHEGFLSDDLVQKFVEMVTVRDNLWGHYANEVPQITNPKFDPQTFLYFQPTKIELKFETPHLVVEREDDDGDALSLDDALPLQAGRVSATTLSAAEIKQISKDLSNQAKKIGELLPQAHQEIHANIVKHAKNAFADKPQVIKNYLDKTSSIVESFEKNPTEFENALNNHLPRLRDAAEYSVTREGKRDFEKMINEYSGHVSSEPVSRSVVQSGGRTVARIRTVGKSEFDHNKHILVNLKTLKPTNDPNQSLVDFDNPRHLQLISDLQSGGKIEYKQKVKSGNYEARLERLGNVNYDGLIMFMNTVICKEFFDFCVKYDIICPFGFIIARPWNQWAAACVVLGRMGASTGITAIFNEDMMWGDDVAVKTHLAHMHAYMNPVIFNQYAFSFVNNAVPVAYYSGGNATFYQTEDIIAAQQRQYQPPRLYEQRQQGASMKQLPSIFPILTAYNDPDLPPVIDLRGNFVTDDKNLVRPHFISTKCNMDVWNFDGSVLRTRHPADPLATDPNLGTINMHCSIANHLVYNPSEDAITRPVIGRDALGKRITAGCMDTLQLKGGERDGVLKDPGFDAIA